jgi:hypothetical protein
MNEPPVERAEYERLLRELDESELYEQKLRGVIVAVRDALAAGEVGRALSMCHQAINEIDSATDVATPAPRLKEQ